MTQQSTPDIAKIPRFLRPHERQQREQLHQGLKQAAESPYLKNASHSKRQILGALSRVERDIESQTAPTLSKTEEDRAAKRCKELEEKIKEKIPSSETMRRNPPGAVAHHMSWERENKANIKEWRALNHMLHPGADGPTMAYLGSLERLRKQTDNTRNYHDSQIPPSTLFSMPPDPDQLGPKAGWPYREPEFVQIFDDSPERVLAEQEQARLEAESKVAEVESQMEAMKAEVEAERKKLAAKHKEYEESIERDRRRQESLRRGRDGK